MKPVSKLKQAKGLKLSRLNNFWLKLGNQKPCRFLASSEMSKKSRKKTVRRKATDAKNRAVFDFGPDFWGGRAGWILVILMFAFGIFAITYSDRVGDLGNQAQFKVATDADSAGYSETVQTSLLRGPHDSVSGESVEANQDMKQYFAVMMDNHVTARPPASLTQAPLVIEAPVEGGITRLMMFVPESEGLSRIGPVRSARPYFIEWSREYDAVLVHVGGSPQALQMLGGYSRDWNLNQMVRGGYFWRDRSRLAPHNVYTSSELLMAALEKIDVPDAERDHTRPFKQGGVSGCLQGDVGVSAVEIDYSTFAYDVTWKYDDETNTYIRYQGTGEYEDQEGRTVHADNVIVQISDIEVIDSVGRKRVRTRGSGDALIFRDGKVIDAEWSKEKGERTKFMFPDNDQEIPINVGITWLQVISADTSIEYNED